MMRQPNFRKIAEDFFIQKINQGLQRDSKFLSIKETELLKMSVNKLTQSSEFTREEVQELQSKCIEALSKAYASDTAGKDRQEALRWRQNNEEIYSSSKAFISSVVQEWYLTVGRKQEKKATGCFTLIATLGLIALTIAVLMIVVI